MINVANYESLTGLVLSENEINFYTRYPKLSEKIDAFIMTIGQQQVLS